MKLTATMMLTVDGVYQGPGGPDEDRRGGFERGGWRRELQVHGSGVLLRWLLERDLVDELNLRIYPVVVGDGLRLFPERGQTHNLELVESRSIPSGVMLQTYRPAGRATFGTAG